MADPASISFQPLSASNLPLGHSDYPATQSTSANAEPSNQLPPPTSTRNGQVIDLTNDSDSTPSTSRFLPRSRNSRRLSASANDDIIFTGRTDPQLSEHTSPSRATSRNQDGQNEPPRERDPRPRTSFMENVANLTAGIHAGFFSVHPTPRSNVPPVQEPSAITIRDSPPLQYRRPGPSTVTFGGGGRFSGGYFSGLVASGLHSFRELTQGTRFGQRDPAEQTLEQLFLEWTNTSRRHPQNNFMARPGINADAGPLFAAMFDFGPPQPTGSTSQSSYVELDSHPHRVKSGFAKEIIPLDREIYNLDSDSSTLSPVKQESKPVCASCDIPLLLGQESTSEASDGRRPWILACGHVVDSKCLEEARQRARHERKARYEKVKTKSRAKGGRGRGRKRNNRSLGSIHEFTLTSVLHGPSSPSIISTPTKRPRLSSQVSNSTPSDVGSNSGLPSDGVSTRTTRARAREARKSADTTSASPQVSRKFLDHCTPLRASPLDTQPPETDTVTQLNKGKGKQVEHKEWRPEHPSPSLLEPVTCEVNGNTIMSIELPPFDLDLPLMLTWIQCPVKSCQGPKGDVLAKKGSKKAPWEMFV